MTFEFEQSQFIGSLPSSVLVLVDPCRRHLLRTSAIPRAEAAGILTNCRAALAHARATGIPVVFVRDRVLNSDSRDEGRSWIRGFEPKRHESIFERVGPSCYGSPYFDEVIDGAGRNIVVAGFIGRGGCLATAADAVSTGHSIVFLSNALHDDLSARIFDASLAGSLKAFTKFDVCVTQTQSWTSTATLDQACQTFAAELSC